LRGGFNCPVIIDPVCLQVEAIALVDAALGDTCAAIGSRDCQVCASDLRSRQSLCPPLIRCDYLSTIDFLILDEIPRCSLLISSPYIEWVRLF
jgi:hypothetical protein